MPTKSASPGDGRIAEQRDAPTPINHLAAAAHHLHRATTAIRMQRRALLVAAADFEVDGGLNESNFVAVVGRKLVHPVAQIGVNLFGQ